MKYTTHSETETLQLGELLAKQLKPGDVLALKGDLGSGKTCLTRGICAGLNVTDPVTSPTFVLINEYESGRLPVYHFDFYRLGSVDEIYDLGLDDYFNSDGVCLIEWPENGLELLPEQHISVQLKSLFESGDEFSRDIEITGLNIPQNELLKLSTADKNVDIRKIR